MKKTLFILLILSMFTSLNIQAQSMFRAHNKTRETTTLIQAASASITIQEATGIGSVVVNWGDGNTNTYPSGLANITHNYSAQQERTIIITSTRLDRLRCTSNSLTALDVTTNTSLTFLVCSSNFLTNLDVSNNKKLTSLRCFSNFLSSLDINSNTSLIFLHCSFNSLTALDVSSNVDLTFIGCEFNPITSLDVSSNVNLTIIDCESNLLTTLDVSSNVDLKYLKCISNSLSILEINNILIDLDINNQTDGTISMENQTPLAPPSGAGLTAKANLITKGLIVTTD